jgi:hypothetical protein
MFRPVDEPPSSRTHQLTNLPVCELSKACSQTFCAVYKLFAQFESWRKAREPAIFGELNTCFQRNACLKGLSELFPNLLVARKLALSL